MPVWAALLFLSTLTHQPDPQIEFGAFADYVTTGRFLWSHLVASILGAALGSIGVVALLIYLHDTPPLRRAAAGMTATVAGNTITSAIFGVAAFAQPAMGRMFQEGAQNSLEFYNEVYGAPLFGSAVVGLLLFIAGGILVGSAIVASGRIPRWAGWTYAISTTVFVLSNFLLPAAQSPASALLFVATVAVAWTVSREPSHVAP
jgi:hypothetical protein